MRSGMIPDRTGETGCPTSQVCASVVFLLAIAENWKYSRSIRLGWHAIHTEFRVNRTAGSKYVYVGGHDTHCPQRIINSEAVNGCQFKKYIRNITSYQPHSFLGCI
jgi:hypothetical protein